MKTLTERKEKLEKREDKAKLIYEWIKSGQISLREFRELAPILIPTRNPNAR